MTPSRRPPTDWTTLLQDVRACWPWPYRDAEIEWIKGQLPAGLAQAAAEAVVRELRLFLCPARAQPEHSLRRSNPRREIRRLKAAAERLLLAIEACDSEALILLRKGAAFPSQRLSALMHALQDFRANSALAAPPALVDQRARRQDAMAALLLNLHRIRSDAYGGVPPYRGWPVFRDACLRPLQETRPGPAGRRRVRKRRGQRRG
jgi:hypothetical protein